MKNLKYILALAFCSLYGYNNLSAQYITPTAGATQTINVTTNGQIFTDPSDGTNGGPGGDCSSTCSSGCPSGNFPNCGCTTVTTLCSTNGNPISVNFTAFRTFATWDILKIFNGTTVASPLMFDGTNVETLAGMSTANGGSTTFTSTGTCLTFSFVATTVVNACGWEAGVTVSGAGGPPPSSSTYPCAQNALDFDGAMDYVTVPNGTSAVLGNTFSISGWVYPKTSTARYQGLFGWRNESNADFYLLQLQNSTTVEARFRNSAGTAFTMTPTTVTLNTWQHFAFTYDGSTIRAYKNGVLVGSMAASGSLTNGNVPFDMGEFRIPSDRFPFNGALDEVSYWNIALSQAQIQSNLTQSFAAPQAGLVAYYKFNQGIASGNNTGLISAFDSSGNNRTGTLNNMTLMGSTSNWVQSGPFFGSISAGVGITENSGNPNDGIVTAGTPVTLTATGGGTYLWNTGATTASINVSPSVTITYTVTVTNAGCSAVISSTISIGTVNPCILVCAGDQAISLPGGICTYMIPNLVTAAGDCEDIMIVKTSALGAGDIVGPGTYVLTYELRSTMGQVIDDCTITITVTPFAPTNSTLTCNDHVNISVDDNCSIVLSADMFLEGNNYSCYTDYQINIWPFNSKENAINDVAQGTPLNIPSGTHTFEITEPNGNTCWGTFTVEDKLAPLITCSCVDDPTQILYVTSLVSPDGNFLDTNSPRYNRPTGATPAACAPTTGGRYYKTIEFEVNVSGTYTFNSNPSVGDTYGNIYQIAFDPNFPCQNYLTGNDDGAGALDPLITINLTAGVKYIYVMSGFGTATVSSNFVINVTSTPAGGSVIINNNPANEPECKFLCYDIEVVKRETVGMLYNIPGQNQNKAKLTAPPVVADACGNVTRKFEDHIVPSMCGATKLIRDWTFTDASGNQATCSQTFTFNKVEINQLAPPAAEVNFTCGLETTPQAIVGYTDLDSRTGTLSAANIGAFADDYSATPTVVELNEGFTNAYFTYQQIGFDGKMHAQKVDIDVCNIYVSYSDEFFAACGLGCGGNMKVVRTWKLLDWCTQEIYEYAQIIKAVDQKAPSFDVKDVTISVTPWNCSADWVVEKPWELQDNCAKPEELKWGIKVEEGVTFTGTQPNYKITGLTKGVHNIVYWAEDCCGNFVEKVAKVTVLDASGPIATAKQNIVLSLSGSGTGADGGAKIYGWQINEGSYDQCTDVRYEVRRVSGGSCSNVGANGTHNNNSTFNDNNSYPSEVPGAVWFHPEDNVQDTDGGAFVKFCCDDIPAGSDHGLHDVELRVWDDGNMNGIYGDNDIIDGMKDNYNTTWVTIRVENKLAPTLICPSDVTVTCDMELNLSLESETNVNDVNLTMTGYPQAYDLCSNLQVTYKDQWVGTHDPVCKSGTVRRTFKVTKGAVVVTCAQFITISTLTLPFTVTFPNQNQTTEWDKCSLSLEEVKNTANASIKRPIVNFGQCDIVGENITIDTFLFEDGACKKWRVKYSYKNWCTGEEINTIAGAPIVHWYAFKDVTAPVLTCTNQMFAANPNPQNPNGGCEAAVALEASASDLLICAEESWVKWQMFFDGWNDGTVDRLGSSFVNKSWNGIWVPQAKYISGVLNPTWVALQNQHPNLPLADLVYVTYIKPTAASGGTAKLPVGTGATAFILDAENISHKVTWKVTDGCGNVDQCESTVMIVDKKAPTPYCVSVSTALMQTNPPMIELWAKDFDKGAFDNCTPQNKLYFSFDGAAPIYAKVNEEHFYKVVNGESVNATAAEYTQGKAYKWLPASRTAGKVWTSSSDFNVQVSVWDEAWNTDYCTVMLRAGEPGGSRVSGTVATASGQGVNDVTVEFATNAPEYPKSYQTIANGSYSEFHMGGFNYTVTAAKGGDYLNGVSTLDLVLIQRHILGLQALDSNYKLIAADANNDGKVTASDLTDLRKLILGITSSLPNNSSWRFPVAGTLVLTSPVVQFTEAINITNLSSEMTNQNFVAVKIGDVNGNVSTSVNSPEVESRSNANVEMSVAEASIAAGEVVEIPVTAANFSEVSGFQYTMNLNGASFVGVQSGVLEVNANNVGVISDNVVTMSYASSEAVNATEGAVLFTLTVKADKAMKVSEMISLNSEVTRAESYNGDLKVGKVSLGVRTAPVAGIELFQNEPNPFKGMTTVSFEMPEAATATLSVYDVTGKVVAVRNINAIKGLNSEIFTKDQLGVSGVLYYTLVSGDYTATKKMIIVE